MKKVIFMLLLLVAITSCDSQLDDCDCVVIDDVTGDVITGSEFNTECENDGKPYYGYQGIIQGTVRCN